MREGFFAGRAGRGAAARPARPGRGHASVIAGFPRCDPRRQRRPRRAGADNIKSLAMVFGAIESAETGRRVDDRSLRRPGHDRTRSATSASAP